MEMENVFTAFKPYLIFTRVLGFSPVSFEKPARKGIVRRATWVVSAAFGLLTVSSLVLNVVSVTKLPRQGQSKILYYGWILPSLSENICLLVLYLRQLRERTSLVCFLKKKDIYVFTHE